MFVWLAPSPLAVDVLQPLSETASVQGISLVMHVKSKAEDGSAQLQATIEAIKTAEDSKVRALPL